jgi:hypothetical protein
VQRRECLKLLGGTLLTPALPDAFAARARAEVGHLSAGDEAFLDEMQRRACLFFMEQAGAESGQVLDRATANNTDGRRDPRVMASIAATGFGLSALCIADKRGYHPHGVVLEQVRRTLRFHCNMLPSVHGFYYHFNDVDTGERYRDVELSSIDTALLLCGVLTARAYFSDDAEIQQLATKIYHRVDWPWMLNGGKTFSMGWKPESGFLESRWNKFCELMMLYLLALGSPTHPIDPACWDAFTRPQIHYDGLTYISGDDPIFTHQYSQAWFDFRGKRDAYANYFQNSITATKAHEAFCLSLGKEYSAEYWGISASDSAHGYRAWGGPTAKGQSFGGVDGSVVPYATAGSLPFLPEACLRVQRSLKDKYGAKAWRRYGFCDAFHPDADWYDRDVLGIDLGISVVMAENLRSGLVWSTFSKNPEVGVAMSRAGFKAARG